MTNDMHTSLLELQIYKMEQDLFKSAGIHCKKDKSQHGRTKNNIYEFGYQIGLLRKRLQSKPVQMCFHNACANYKQTRIIHQ